MDQGCRVGLPQGEIRNANLGVHIVLEANQFTTDPGLLGKLDQVFAPLVLLDLTGPGQHRIEIAIFIDQQCCGLDPDPRHPGYVVGGIPGQRLHIDDPVRGDPELVHDLIGADHQILHRVEHRHAAAHQLHQILVRGHHHGLDPRGLGLAGIGGNQVIGLKALHLDRGQAKRLSGLTDQGKLRAQLLRGFVPVGLVFRINIVAERLARGVKDDRHIIERAIIMGPLDQLHQHRAVAVNGVGVDPVRAAKRLQRAGMESTENESRAIDQIEPFRSVTRAGSF